MIILFTESEKFKYLSDIVYTYEYRVNVETLFAGSSNNRSTLDIKAQVKIAKYFHKSLLIIASTFAI